MAQNRALLILRESGDLRWQQHDWPTPAECDRLFERSLESNGGAGCQRAPQSLEVPFELSRDAASTKDPEIAPPIPEPRQASCDADAYDPTEFVEERHRH